VRLIAEELANNHTNKHIKNVKEKKKKVVLQEAHLREEVLLPAEDHLVEAQKKNKQSTSK
jgi:hypothetical protein